jgi:hypothetical protein
MSLDLQSDICKSVYKRKQVYGDNGVWQKQHLGPKCQFSLAIGGLQTHRNCLTSCIYDGGDVEYATPLYKECPRPDAAGTEYKLKQSD